MVRFPTEVRAKEITSQLIDRIKQIKIKSGILVFKIIVPVNLKVRDKPL
jgi:hypothetical protein